MNFLKYIEESGRRQRDLVNAKQVDEHSDLILRYAVDDLAIISDQLYQHLSHVKPDVSLSPQQTTPQSQRHYYCFYYVHSSSNYFL